MEKEIKKTQKTDKGPWLLSEDALKTIDSIMEKAYNDFINLGEKREGDYPNKLTNRKILTVWFNDDIKTEVNSFKEIFISETYSKLKPIKFEYAIEVGYNRVNVELNGEWSNSYFQYYVNCNDNNIENNIIYDIQNIYNVEKPKRFFIIASKIGPISWLAYFLILMVMVAVLNSKYQTPINNVIKNKLYTILSKDNLDQNDYFEIIKYTTIYNFEFYTLIENEKAKEILNIYNKILNNYLLAGFLFCIIFTFNPRASFSVGKGISKVRKWKMYYKIILYIIPTMIIIPILINIISEIIMRNN
jgi:hypothetical protein